MREYRAEISRAEQARKVGKQGGRGKKKTPGVDSAPRVSGKKRKRTSIEVAKAAKLPERKLRLAQEIDKAAPELIDRVRSGQLTLVEAKRVFSDPYRTS